MFYAHFVLAKKGPLARIWLAAHWDKKLTKAHVFETNIEKSVDGILQPKVKMALRTSGHLLLGVVRIYSRKAKYLLADCNEAFVKIKMAFRPGMVDLPEDNREANVNAITLPEVFHDFDTAIPELNDVDIQAQFSLNQSRAEEITMREDYSSLALAGTSGAPGSENLGVDDEGFGDMLSFDRSEAGPADLLRDASAADQGNLLFSDHNVTDHRAERSQARPSTSSAPQPMDIDIPIRDDGFGGNLGQDIIGTGLFEGGLFDDAPLDTPGLPPEGSSVQEEAARAAAAAAALVGVSKGDLGRASQLDDSDDDGMDFGGAPSPMGGHSDDDDNSRPGSGLLGSTGLGLPGATPGMPRVPDISHLGLPPDLGPEVDRAADQTTLIHNEEESFALAPVDTATVKGLSKAKRKRKLIVDEIKNISGEEMKAQLSDTSDIVTTLDLAPPTKRLMHWKESGGVEKLFALPGRPIPARQLFKCYLRHLTSKPSENEDFGTFGDLDRELVLEQVRGGPETSAIGQLGDLGTSGIGDIEQPHSMLMPPATPATPQKQKPGRKRKIVEEEPPMMLDTPQTPLMPPVMPPDMSNLSNLLPPDHMPTPDHLGASMLGQQMHSTPAPMMHHDPGMPDPSLMMGATPHPMADPSLTHPMQQQQMPMENLGYDQNNGPLMANMGYDEQLPPAVTPGGHGPTTPWHDMDNEEFPHSVGPPEEQQTDETYEQYEERVLNKRATHMYHILKGKLDVNSQRPMFFSEMTHRNSRKQVAQKFYTLLVLKKFEAVELRQEKSYADIAITPGPKFDNNSL